MAEQDSIITVDQAHLQSLQKEAWDYLAYISTAYQEALTADTTGSLMSRLNIEQHTLMAFIRIHSQLLEGGYIQLIQNGFGAYTFDNPFAQVLQQWGASKLSDNLNQARLIYQAKKEQLERETTLEEFAKMYQEIPDFQDLDDAFLAFNAEELRAVHAYVSQHLKLFI